MISQLLAQPTHGLVSQLSRSQSVSRQTLYRWAEIARHALSEALGNRVSLPTPASELARLVLTLVIETHASDREIQACLKTTHGISISLGRIVGIVKEAGQRAHRCLERQRATTPRALALDEQDSSQRGQAYLNVIDVHRGQVWMSVPPVGVDGESWTLVCWLLQDQGLLPSCLVSDGGHAIAEGISQMDAPTPHQRDVWHLFQLSANVQGRLETLVKAEETHLAASQRFHDRQMRGQRAAGRPPKLGLEEQQGEVTRQRSIAQGVRSLCQELQTFLEVVVPRATSLLTSQQRLWDIEAALDLLEELAQESPAAMKAQIGVLARQFRLALPNLLWFAHALDPLQNEGAQDLSPEVVAFVGWAWLRRRFLADDQQELLAGLAPAWRPAAHRLFPAWEHAVRARSAVENWHSIVRPHLSVHRTLSAGMLSLLAVWHHHRIAPRGPHAGLSPLQRTDLTTVSVHWLAALGYSPLAA